MVLKVTGALRLPSALCSAGGTVVGCNSMRNEAGIWVALAVALGRQWIRSQLFECSHGFQSHTSSTGESMLSPVAPDPPDNSHT